MAIYLLVADTWHGMEKKTIKGEALYSSKLCDISN